MNLFNTLNQRYGQRLVKEVRTLESLQHKLAKMRNHRVFNLRCLKQKLVPDSAIVKFKTTNPHEEKIIRNTQTKLVDNRIRANNQQIKELQKSIESSKNKIKEQTTTTHFNLISKTIDNSTEKVYKTIKKQQQRKLNKIAQSSKNRNYPVPENVSNKWIINLSSKQLTDGETKLLQRGPKFAVSNSRLPINEYVAATKQICDALGENNQKLDCTDYYHKVRDLLTQHKGKRIEHNITREEKEALKSLRDDKDRMVLTADKGVALVVIDKSQYIEKCLALLNDTKVYAPCRDETKTIHNKVQKTLRELSTEDGTGRLHGWRKTWYNRLMPSGTTSPPARFYGLPKIHKSNCPMRPIVSACGTSTYNLAKFLTKILKTYTGKSSSFVKDSQDLVQQIQGWEVADDEELVSFDVSALFTSIPVDRALDVIHQLFLEHEEDPTTDLDELYKCSFQSNTCGLYRWEVMDLLRLVLNNCVFTFQGKFYKQLHGAAMGSPCSPVVANIYMEFFERKAWSPVTNLLRLVETLCGRLSC